MGKDGKIQSIEDIYLNSLPIKEYQIIDIFFAPGTLKEWVPCTKLGRLVVGSPTMKKMLSFAGVADCFTSSCGHTRTKANFMKATFEALRVTYSYLTPDLWRPTHFVKPPFQEWSDYLSQSKPTTTY